MSQTLTLLIDEELLKACLPDAVIAQLDSTAITTAQSYDEVILLLFGHHTQSEFPHAAVTGLLHDEIDTTQGVWCRVDPVALHADMRRVFYLGNDTLALTHQEAQLLSQDIAQHFQELGWQLYTPTATSWFLNMQTSPDIKTYCVHSLGAGALENIVHPCGQYQSWRRYFTEIQMLLHQHSVNMRRQHNGEQLVSALWFWGVGEMPTKGICTYDLIISEHELLQSQALLHEVPMIDSLNDSRCVMERIRTCQHALLEISLSHNALQGQHYLDLLMQQLKQNNLVSINIQCTNGNKYLLHRQHLNPWWKFW